MTRLCEVFIVKYPAPLSPQLWCHHKSQTHLIQSSPKGFDILFVTVFCDFTTRSTNLFTFLFLSYTRLDIDPHDPRDPRPMIYELRLLPIVCTTVAQTAVTKRNYT